MTNQKRLLLFFLKSFIVISMKSLIFLLLIASPLTLCAQDAKTWRLSLGAGAVIKKNQRVGNTYKRLHKKYIIAPIPIVQAGYGRVSLGGQGLSVMALGHPMMNVSAFINRGGERYYGAGMIPRKESFFAGISAKFFGYGLNISRDINGKSKGYIAQLSYGRMKLISEKLVLRTGLSLDWYDDRYADYYYGVRNHEATASRREYHVNNYIQPGVNLMPIYKIQENVSMMGAAGVKFIPKSLRESPTMNGKKLEFGGLVGISYNF